MSFLDNAKKALSAKSSDEYEDERDYEYEDEYEEKKPRKSIFSFLTGKADDEYEDEYEEEDVPAETASSRASYYSSSRSSSDRYSSNRYASSASAKTPIRYNPTASSNTEVVLITLTNFDDSEKIVREVKSGKITIFDVSEIDSTEDARRIVDYISGAAAGMECPFSRLCHGIFCITPKGVTITTKKSRYM